METECGQLVVKFVGDDRVKGGAVVHKEHPDVGVFSIVEEGCDGI